MVEEGVLMRIQDRICALEGVTDVLWVGKQNRLVVYFSNTISLFTMKIRVVGAIADAHLQNAIEQITFISHN